MPPTLSLATSPAPKSALTSRRRLEVLPIGIFLAFAVLPAAAPLAGGEHLLSLGSRVMIFAIAAVALDLLVGLAVALLLYVVVSRTRLGMLIRAGAANRVMLGALGVNVRVLYTLVFALGAALAALAGVMAGPIFTVESGMGESVLISAFVVIVIGGIGSIRGAFLAALLVGLVDTLGRSFSVDILRLFMAPSPARTVGPAIASMLIYLLMAVVLYLRPTGLFPAKGRA